MNSNDDRSPERVVFELLCVDDDASTTVQNERQLASLIYSHAGVCGEEANFSGSEISAPKFSIRICPEQKFDDAVENADVLAFEIRMSGDFRHVCPRRKPLVEHLKKNGFSSVLVIRDEVSQRIGTDLYPFLNRAENLLRNYLTRFLITKLGPRWWRASADSSMSEKAQKRKNNETHFGNLIEKHLFLIDFGDLGALVYRQTSGFVRMQDVVSRVTDLDPEDADGLRQLQADLKGNYQKFFKTQFKDKGFQQKWESLEKLRHKTAHNGLFACDDLEQGKNLAEDVADLIKEAIRELAPLEISRKERDGLSESLVTDNGDGAQGGENNGAQRDRVLELLKESEAHFKNLGGFVGVGHFIKTFLTDRGFSLNEAYRIVDLLAETGEVELYEHQKDDMPRPVTAIRVANTETT